MKKFRLKSLIILLFVCCLSTFYFTKGNAQIGHDIETLLTLRDEHSLKQAQQILEKALIDEPEAINVLILLAEVHFYYGDLLQGEQQIECWGQGQDYAEQALALDPTSANAHYWIAASMGKIGRARGILNSLFLVSPMLHHLEMALDLEPDHSWAHFVLSHLYQELPPKPFGKGDRQLALTYAQRAWELEPTEGEFSLHYAELLLKQKRKEEAKKVLTAALVNPKTRWTDSLRMKAEEILDKL